MTVAKQWKSDAFTLDVVALQKVIRVRDGSIIHDSRDQVAPATDEPSEDLRVLGYLPRLELPMATIEENREHWQNQYTWPDDGEECVVLPQVQATRSSVSARY